MEPILLAIIVAIIVVWVYLAINKEPDSRHPLESVKRNSEITPMPVLTEEIKIEPPVVESAPVETAVVAPVEVQAETKEETVKPKQEKKMATKKPAPAKAPVPAKAPAKPAKPKK
jgi:hypothetical protein